jgi:hypothetical protein
MGCCGKARANLSVSRAAIPRAFPSASRASGTPAGTIPAQSPAASARALNLRYVGPSEIVVRGPLTGRSYAFSQDDPFRSVDRRDAEMLLRTRYFRPM